jgi:hypothetical protein
MQKRFAVTWWLKPVFCFSLEVFAAISTRILESVLGGLILPSDSRGLTNIFKKSNFSLSDELHSKLPKSAPAPKKINVDNQALFRYSIDYCFRLMEAAICCAEAEADTQFAIFP